MSGRKREKMKEKMRETKKCEKLVVIWWEKKENVGHQEL